MPYDEDFTQKLRIAVFPEDARRLQAIHLQHKEEFTNLVEEAEVEYLLFKGRLLQPARRSNLPDPDSYEVRIAKATARGYYFFLDLTNLSHNQRYLAPIIFPHSTLDTTDGLYIPYEPTYIQKSNIEDLLRYTNARIEKRHF